MIAPYPHQRSLLAAVVVSSTLFWLGLALLMMTVADRYLPELGPEYPAAIIAAIAILAHTGFYIRKAKRVAYLHGHAVEIGPRQHPDLHARLRAVCKRLGIENVPNAYLFQDPRLGNSFGLRFRRQDYIAVNGELIGALTERQGAIDFYIGYELARIRDRHARWAAFLSPATALPLLGPAYSRAQIYRYDRFGLAGSKTRVDAAFALAVQASGSRRWKSFNVAQFAAQSLSSRSFWMSLIELTSGIPWLSKRIAQLRAIATDSDAFVPRRHLLAYPAALLVPHVGLGSGGGAVRLLFVLLWAGIAVNAGVLGYRQLLESGVLEQIESRFEDKIITFPWSGTTGRGGLPPTASEAEIGKDEAADTYARLDADLKRLGSIARERQKKQGGIPCEVGNIAALQLNYRADRYAFSCDEPTVYTVIEAGEFEPGRPSYLRVYNWKEKRLAPGGAAKAAGEK